MVLGTPALLLPWNPAYTPSNDIASPDVVTAAATTTATVDAAAGPDHTNSEKKHLRTGLIAVPYNCC